MNEDRERPRPWSRVVSADCPVGVTSQVWIEASMSWFAREFGPWPSTRGLVLLDAEAIDGFTGTPKQIDRAVAVACDLLDIDHSALTVELFDRAGESEEASRRERRAVGHYYVRDGRAVIALDVTEASDAAYLTAVIAHELCHVRLLGEGRITADREDHERLTDLLTVFFGFGVFTTNASLRFGETGRGFSVQPLGYLDERTLNAARNDGYSRLGYLTEREFGYAMACYAWLRNDPEPDWAGDLDPGPRTYLRQGLAYLSRSADPGRFPTRRTGTVPVSVRVVPQADRVWLAGLYFMLEPTRWPPAAPGHRPL